MDLFTLSKDENLQEHMPLAFRMRPRKLDEIMGQKHLTDVNAPFRKLIEADRLHSFILYGPPGTGKTSIAKIIASHTNAKFEYIQAVISGVNDIRKIAFDAEERLKFYQKRTILFVDEIHRFNKGQQDVLLPYVEEGILVLIGATTQNPLYEINNALLSRVKLYILEALDENDIKNIIFSVLEDKERGFGKLKIEILPESLDIITRVVKGDARMALNILDMIISSYYIENEILNIDKARLEKLLGKQIIRYDRSDAYHYDCISAFIKSIRGSDPDATMFWLAYMIEGGEDPKYIARRLLVHAAEDIGLADPNALLMASAAAHAVEFLGLPEARIPLAEVSLYLATAPKSNSSLIAIDKAIQAVRNEKKISVPLHIADTSHSKAKTLLGKGIDYKYPHSFLGYVEQDYLPDELKNTIFYEPSNNGHEENIKKFMESLHTKRAKT